MNLHCVLFSSANILFDHHYNAKVADFGFARQLTSIADGHSLMTAPMFAKSLGYFPPELQYLKKNPPKSDIYSYGVVRSVICITT